MKNDFISIFKTIELAEQQRFHQYIHFFHGQHKIVLNVFDEVVQAIAANGEEAFSASVSKNKKMQNDLSDLKKWLLTFLTIQEAQTNSLDAQFLTLEALRKRKLTSAFSQKAKQMDKILRGHPSPDMWLLFRQLRLTHINYFDKENDSLEDLQVDLCQLLDDLDSFYMSAKLKYCVEVQSRKEIYKEEYNPRLLDDILLLIEKDDSINQSVKNLYFPLFKLIKEKSEVAYWELKSFLLKEQEHERSEKLSVLLYLLNFAISEIRQNKPKYFDEYFDLTQIGLHQKLFIASGFFPVETFLNIVNLGVHLQKFEWVNNFIQDWSPYLELHNRKITENMALARLYFEKNKFEEVIDLLQQIPHKNLLFSINARVLLARAYYEKGETQDLILDYCKALYLYVYRNQTISSDLQVSAMNFIKILRMMVSGKTKHQLFEELNKNEEPVMCHQWLIAKVEKLAK